VTLVKGTLSPRSAVVADTRTSQLIVTTTEKELDQLNAVVARLDTPTRQVLIEAKLIETALNPRSLKGIDWSGTLEAQHFSIGNNTPDQQAFKPGTPAQPPPPGGTVGTVGTPDTPAVFGRVFSDMPKVAVNSSGGFYPPVAFLNADGVSAVLSFIVVFGLLSGRFLTPTNFVNILIQAAHIAIIGIGLIFSQRFFGDRSI